MGNCYSALRKSHGFDIDLSFQLVVLQQAKTAFRCQIATITHNFAKQTMGLKSSIGGISQGGSKISSDRDHHSTCP